ncbi:hypothetical protein [Ulvibacterium sp.]|uniref:hypothetical protein n=1 Tax=Ulvibacterium sp. TaxID=2665914 RepID=UPI00260A3EA8|nr:hypothetical protein [Ulvibacterium sp.]
MAKESKGKILNRIFEELENCTHTSEELDKKLEQLGVNPETLSKDGLNIVERYLSKKDNSSSKTRSISMGSNIRRYPIAAAKKRNKNDLKNKIQDIIKSNKNISKNDENLENND